MNKEMKIAKIISILDKEFERWDVPVIKLKNIRGDEPYKILISTIISLRTRDEVTIDASKRLFKLLDKPFDVKSVSVEQIENAIYPAGFYRRKARQIKDISNMILSKYKGVVPDNIDELLKFEGIGRKSANLILSEGYGQNYICVDTHVHRISNRLGIINTKDVYESEIELGKVLPEKYYRKYNYILVGFGQKICKPISPFCSVCPVKKLCDRVGVDSSR
jgi:endonuclease-3